MKRISSAASLVFCFLFCLSLAACVRRDPPSSLPSDSTTAIGSTTVTTTTATSGRTTTKRSRTTTQTVSQPTTTTSATTTVTSTTTTSVSTVRVLIPAGFTLVDIAQAMEDNRICSKESFLNIAQNYTFKNSLLAKMPTANRYFKLEGYLYPGEYTFAVNTTPQVVIEAMLAKAQANIEENYSFPHWTIDQIIKLASIIQKESDDPVEMQRISSVLHNRRSAKLSLQADSTVAYVAQVLRPYVTGDRTQYDSFYNTYVCADLPSGPIASPGRDALYAAANPESTEYLYYFRDPQGTAHFALTEAEHQKQRADAGYTPPILPPTEPTTTTSIP